MSRDSSPRLPIRCGMDVYNVYQNRYLGSVVRVWQRSGEQLGPEKRAAIAQETGPRSSGMQGTPTHGVPPLTHEEGQAADPTSHQGTRQLGEELGPFPTIGVGNRGPINQSAAHSYATERDDPLANVHVFAVRPGRINLGPLTSSIYIPVSAVCSVSMERVVVDIDGKEIPAAWRNRPREGDGETRYPDR